MRLLFSRLSKFVENTVVQVAVVVQFIVFVNFFDAHSELDDHVFIKYQLFDRLREDVDCLKVGFGCVEGRQNDRLGGKVTEHGVLGGVQVPLCEVERLVDEGVELVPVTSLHIDKFFLNDQLLSIVKDVH